MGWTKLPLAARPFCKKFAPSAKIIKCEVNWLEAWELLSLLICQKWFWERNWRPLLLSFIVASVPFRSPPKIWENRFVTHKYLIHPWHFIFSVPVLKFVFKLLPLGVKSCFSHADKKSQRFWYLYKLWAWNGVQIYWQLFPSFLKGTSLTAQSRVCSWRFSGVWFAQPRAGKGVGGMASDRGHNR